MKPLSALLLVFSASLQFGCSENIASTPEEVHRVVFIVLDGVRTEEVFMGNYRRNVRAYRKSNKKYKRYKKKRKKRINGTQKKARRSLMPFVWKKLAKRSQAVIVGNRFVSKHPNCYITNQIGHSLPAYADLLSGRRQLNVRSNWFKGTVRYQTIPDFLYDRGVNPGAIRIYTSWKHIKKVVSKQKSPPFYIHTGYKRPAKKPPWPSAGYDRDIFKKVEAFLKRNEDFRYLFIAFNDTDEWAHRGNYARYLKSLKKQDSYIEKIYKLVYGNPRFKNTSFFITTDHGRGSRSQWPYHSTRHKGSRYIWAVVYSPLFNSGIEKRRFVQSYLEGKCSHTSLGRLALDLLNNSVEAPGQQLGR